MTEEEEKRGADAVEHMIGDCIEIDEVISIHDLKQANGKVNDNNNENGGCANRQKTNDTIKRLRKDCSRKILGEISYY